MFPTAVDAASEVDLATRIELIRGVIRDEYGRPDGGGPWVVGFSGGKDSTLLTQLVWDVVMAFPPSDRRRDVLIVGNDTLVESPLVVGHLHDTVAGMKEAAGAFGLPIKTRITKPNIDETFWACVIGRGYMPPTRNFRWCTDRMKIKPTSALLRNMAGAHNRVLMLIGTRKSESDSRRRRMEGRDVVNPHSSIAGAFMFTPLADLTDDDVWMWLLENDPPWGGSHFDLAKLYRDAGGGECPLVTSQEDAPSCGTTSPRFGCWTCSVVRKDKSLQGLVDSKHTDAAMMAELIAFRQWLIDLREDNGNRYPHRRNGQTKFRKDGSRVYGPFTLEARQHILNELQALEKRVDRKLISRGELDVIADVWRRDGVAEGTRKAFAESQTAVAEGANQGRLAFSPADRLG